MRKIIRLGDPTSHGGKVVSATSHVTVGGIPVARVGDRCTCPVKGHNNCVITEGDSNWLIDGIPVALEGCGVSCGAVVLSTAPNTGRVYDGGGDGFGGNSLKVEPLSSAVSTAYPNTESKFDEQLLFTGEQGQAYAHVKYVLFLGDGRRLAGSTDEEGKTERIVTESPTVIERAEFFSKSPLTCCAKHAEESDSAQPAVKVDLQEVKTNPQALGTSVAKVTAKDESRPLTSGEIVMCKLIFKDAVNYGLVKVHKGEYLWFGMQDDNTAMTPNGEMYFNPKHFREDFSREPITSKLWFVHEMVHVWQFQLGYGVKRNGLMLHAGGGDVYEYDLKQTSKFHGFNMEQQGDIVSDYFGLTELGYITKRSEKYGGNSELYRKVLSDFLENPSNVLNLPQ